MITYFLVLIAGLVILVTAADRFVIASASLARNWGVSSLIIGLTVVGLGTSAPEIIVSAMSSLDGNGDLAIGNALGSNIANIGLILGITALVAPLSMHSGLLRKELPVLMLISLACYVLTWIGGLSLIDGVLMLLMLATFLGWLLRTAVKQRHDPYTSELKDELPEEPGLPTNRALLWFVIALIGLLASSRALVWSAVHIAEAFGVSELVIGLTIVAVGTSLPELAANISSVLKHEDDLAIGNIIGSNLYNLLAVYSLPPLFDPMPAPPGVLDRDFPWMLAFTAALILFGFITKRHGIGRLGGLSLLTAYAAYQYCLISGTT